jgi:hypothetical protein
MARVKIGTPVEGLDDPVADIACHRAASHLDVIEDSANAVDVTDRLLSVP